MVGEMATGILTQKKVVLPLLAVALLALAVTSVIYGHSNTCGFISLLPGGNVVNDTWSDGCQSEVPERGYARYYPFRMSEPATVAITLESHDADPFLYLRSGDGKSGEILAENDDYTDGNTQQSHIVADLDVGTYTVEVTTYETDKTGAFKLTVRGIPDTGEFDIPTPTPAPRVSISISNGQVCALNESGRVKCQEVETEGRTAPQEGQIYVAIASDDLYTCGLTGEGWMICWGTESKRTLWTTQPVTSTVHQHSILNVDESGAIFGPWVLSLGCTRSGNAGAFLRRTKADVFDDATERKQLSLLTEIGGVREMEVWYLIPPDKHYSAYLSHWDGGGFVKRLLEAESLRVTIRYESGQSVVNFNVGGLDQKIGTAEDACTARRTDTQSKGAGLELEQLQSGLPALREVDD